MHCPVLPKYSVIVMLAAFATLATAEEQTLQAVRVTAQAERADGPVDGYRATRSATFTKTDTPLKEVPASVSVVPAELMKDQAMQSLADVFRYIPGATNHQGEGNRDQVVLRGISTSADFYVDGMRDDAQVFRDLYNLERVEVLKGPGGMIFGRGGAGGVVNRVTKKPVFGHVGEVAVTLGTQNQLRGTLDIGEKIGDSGAWRMSVMGEHAGSFRDDVEMDRYAINPTATFLLTPQTAVTLGFEHLKDNRTADRGVPARNGRPIPGNVDRFYGNADQSVAKSTVDGAYAIVDHDFGNGTQFRNSFRVTHYDKFYQNVYPDNANASSVNAVGNMRLAAYNNANQRTNVFNQSDLTTRFTTGGFEHTLLAGLELGYQDSSNQRNTGFFGGATTVTVPAANPFATATLFRQNANDANNRVTANIAAAYLQDQIALTQSLKLLAGLRFDHFKTNFDDRRAAGVPGQTIPATDLSRTDNAWSPRLGLIWSPTQSQTYYASYSYSFLPSAETLGLTVLNAATGASSADFAPEKAINYEVGGRWDLMPGLSLSSALFRLNRNNVRNSDGQGGFVQVGQQQTDGVEIGLQGDVTSQWKVYGGFTYLDGRVTKATQAANTLNHRPQLEPQNSFSLWNRYDIGNGWAGGLGVVHQGVSYTNVDNVVSLPAFTRLDGALYYAFAGGKTKLALNLENLTNREYFPTADGNNNISPGAPRNARLTLSHAF
ncbi:TonB-dependent siderophore receptor [Dechloromonas sp. XY25]|uniref:TonB-dependent siderophore receptor n=1 Tax=Dechloromonas hankyongensis TaxID=2908002 RepID=A0ABS9K2V8_9RHOO|nr:TonB-dependent siderophore receptor [Dechloromonas hankyongensis]MCG2577488.1 TonB-dependent siderophore receptor [Dechloromonas hankyongensis]